MEDSNSIVIVFLLILAASSAISFCNGNLNLLCKENERQALLTFKQDLKDTTGFRIGAKEIVVIGQVSSAVT